MGFHFAKFVSTRRASRRREHGECLAAVAWENVTWALMKTTQQASTNHRKTCVKWRS